MAGAARPPPHGPLSQAAPQPPAEPDEQIKDAIPLGASSALVMVLDHADERRRAEGADWVPGPQFQRALLYLKDIVEFKDQEVLKEASKACGGECLCAGQPRRGLPGTFSAPYSAYYWLPRGLDTASESREPRKSVENSVGFGDQVAAEAVAVSGRRRWADALASTPLPPSTTLHQQVQDALRNAGLSDEEAAVFETLVPETAAQARAYCTTLTRQRIDDATLQGLVDRVVALRDTGAVTITT